MSVAKVGPTLDLVTASLEGYGNEAVKKARFNACIRHPAYDAAYQHCAWMMFEAMKFEDEEKRQRWIGFVQGVLWATGEHSIADLKEAANSDADYPPSPSE